MFCGLKGGTPSVHLHREAETTSQKGLTGCQNQASHWSDERRADPLIGRNGQIKHPWVRHEDKK